MNLDEMGRVKRRGGKVPGGEKRPWREKERLGLVWEGEVEVEVEDEDEDDERRREIYGVDEFRE